MADDAGGDDYEAVWRRVEELSGFVPVGGVGRDGATVVEIVKTYADSTLTAVFYRRDGDWRVHPYPVDPPELVGGMSGRGVGDLHVVESAPVRPGRHEIGLSLGRSLLDDDVPAMRVPVDRSRTARFDRFLAQEPPPMSIGGVRVRLAAAAAGLVQMTADVVVEAEDAAILAIGLGAHFFRPHVHAGPGPAGLWRDWHPAPDGGPVVRSVDRDGRITVSATTSETITAVQLTPAEAAKLPPPPPDPPPDWRAWSTPEWTPLPIYGSGGASGPPRRRPVVASTLRFAAPATSAEGAVIELTQLWSYRFGGSSVTVPAPAHDRSVPLEGAVLDAPGGQVELLEWAPVDVNGYQLTGRCTPEDTWPDLRVMAAGSSASLWSGPPHDGILIAGLPRSHRALFDRPQLEIALRLTGQRVDGAALAAPLVSRAT